MLLKRARQRSSKTKLHLFIPVKAALYVCFREEIAMKKVILLGLVMLAVCAGCASQRMVVSDITPKQRLVLMQKRYTQIMAKYEDLESQGKDMAEVKPLLKAFRVAGRANDIAKMDQILDQLAAKFKLMMPVQYYDHSLRLLTYNTQFLPWIATLRSASKDERRARSMAAEIKSTGADVVVLNEVFDEDARPVLVGRLKNTYRYYISKIEDTLDLDDSGLMLFSRYPFTTQVKPIVRGTNMSISSTNSGIPYDVSFVEFKSTFGHDSLASKGMGLVKIKVPRSETAHKLINVAFTHMQASYDPPHQDADGPKTRAIQMINMWNLMRDVFHSPANFNWALEHEEFYLVGDLNIDGNLKNRQGLATYYNTPEWQYHFQGMGFYAKTMQDGWANETSPLDIGQTSGDGFPYFLEDTRGQRLDYVLHNKPNIQDAGLCLQHIRIAWELADAFGTHLSDHLGVFADFNLAAPLCNPRTAAINPPLDQWVSGTLTYKGSMQWYRIDTPGSYSFEIMPVNSNRPVRYHIYEATDLSRPLADYHGQITEWGRKFVLPKAPFYIRVFSPDRTFSGKYQLKIHRHIGKYKADSISILPYASKDWQVPPMPLNPENAIWFDFFTEVADQGKYIYPELTFLITDTRQTPFSFLLLDEQETILSYPRTIAAGGYRYGAYTKIITHSKLPQGKYYLKVLPMAPQPANHKFTLEWRTTLTYFTPLQLQCIEQTDTVGDDEMYYLLRSDGAGMSDYAYLADFDTDQLVGLTGRINALKFVHDLRLDLAENDVDSLSDDDYFAPYFINLEVHHPPFESEKVLTYLTWPDQPISGEYRLHYRLSHRGLKYESP